MAYATINKPTDYFDTLTWSGDNTSPRSLTGLDFQPDWVWIKRRSSAKDHGLFDSVRGGTKKLESNSNSAEINGDNGQISSFNSDGFSVITGTADNSGVNATSSTYVGWNWLAGGTASSNTDGDITSTVSANTTSGFSIVSYTGNGTGGATVGHGLGIKPKIVFYKRRDTTSDWTCLQDIEGSLKYGYLNTTAAFLSAGETPPTSSLLYLSSGSDTNASGGTNIAYCFAEIKGYSKFGSYTGNGNADGPFIYTGFKPSFVMVKRTDTTNNWLMYDNKRDSDNIVGNILFPNLSNAQDIQTTVNVLDFTSNGFKLRSSSAATNASGGTYIYMAFAEAPLVGTNNIPATAR